MSEALRDAVSHQETVSLDLYRYWKTIHPQTGSKLSMYTQPLSKLGTDYIVSLRITCLPRLHTPDFIALAGLGNLDSLDISDILPIADMFGNLPRRSLLTDRLVRAWSEVEGAFPALTFLRLRPGGHRLELTKRSLEYICKFPLLRVYHVVLPIPAGGADDDATGAEFEGMHEYPSCGWECITSLSDSDSEATYLEHLRRAPIWSTYENDDTIVVPAQLPGDSPAAAAYPPPRAHVRWHAPDPSMRRAPGTLARMFSPEGKYSYTHYESFWRCGLMDSAPPIYRCGQEEAVPEEGLLVLPPKPHVSVLLMDEFESSGDHNFVSHGDLENRRGYALHRRLKLAPYETRGLMRPKTRIPGTENLSWPELEKVLARQPAEDQGKTGKRKLEAAADEISSREKTRVGEQVVANMNARRAARQRKKLGVSDMGDIFKGMLG